MRYVLRASRGVALSLALIVVSNVYSAPTHCPEFYADGIAPNITNPKLKEYSKELCYSAYGTMYSGMARAPIWSAQYLTRASTEAAKNIPRSNDFRENEGLVEDWRSRLTDFRGSGYDRGHVAPAGDMPSYEADSESFLLSNIIAQNDELNRNLWAAIELAVRKLSHHRPVYVITGPLWLGPEVNWLRGRVMVPTHMYKLVYDPSNDEAGAYLVENKARAQHSEISLAELEVLANIDFLPTKSPKIMKLPRPRY